MTWTNETSPPEDATLERALSAVNMALDHRVRLSTQMRVTACVQDILSFSTLLRSLAAAEVRRAEVRDEEIAEWQRSDKRMAPRGEWDSRLSFQFAAAVKAIFYFVRALQDAAYAALLEASGSKAGPYSSMNDCAKKESNPIRPLIDQALPDYFAWFTELRDIRNQMKLGLSTAFGFRGSAGEMDVRIILQQPDDKARHVSSGRELTLSDIERCLTMSARLLQWTAEYLAPAA